MNRHLAVEEWTKLKYRDQDEEPYESSLACLDLFVLTVSRPGDFEDVPASSPFKVTFANHLQICERLDSYAASIRRDHPEVDEQSPRQIARLVARYLITKGWTGIGEGREYHNIEHNFLGVALYSDGHNSLPLISAVIYCYVLRKFGLQAAPCGFPIHVHALVRPPIGVDLDGDPCGPDSAVSTMYMDPFRSEVEVPVSSLDEQLRMISYRFTQRELDEFLGASTAREITLRAARNILNAQRTSHQDPLEDVNRDAAAYGAWWALALFPSTYNPDQHRQAIRTVWQTFAEGFIHDVGLIQSHIVPMMSDRSDFNQNQRACQQLRHFDEQKRYPKRRSDPANSTVKYKIGHVFKHRRYGYYACIHGWDHECKSGEAWIQQMGVDRLARGRSQAFYQVL